MHTAASSGAINVEQASCLLGGRAPAQWQSRPGSDLSDASTTPTVSDSNPSTSGAPSLAHPMGEGQGEGSLIPHSALRTPHSFLPDTALESFAALPESVRLEFRKLTLHLPSILRADNRSLACKAAAADLGLAWKTIDARIRRYESTHDWRDLLNKAKAGPALWQTTKLIGLPKTFLQFYLSLCERNQRVDRGGYRELVQIYRTHLDAHGQYYDKIPGYPHWPQPDPRTDLPTGWTYSNLQRQADAHPFDQHAARVSLFSASQFRPPVLTTRVGLRLFERIELDDHEYNVKIHFPGQYRAMRPRGFNAVDALSACIFAQSFKPTLWDMEAEQKRALTETDFMWFVVNILTTYGYRSDDCGTTLVVERGTAAIKNDFAARIFSASQGKVKISLPGMFGAAAHPGQFDGRSKGNFKHKPLVEGSFSLVDNYFAALVGQTGLDRNTFPDDTAGREAYLQTLLKDLAKAPQDRAANAILPVLTWSQFLHYALELYQAINTTPDHNLEGWDTLGFQALEYRPTDQSPWLPAPTNLALPYHPSVSDSNPSASGAPSLARRTGEGQGEGSLPTNQILTRARRLSRQEVFARYRHELTRVPPILFPELMGLENGRELTVTKQSLFEFDDTQYSSDPFRFLATTHNGHAFHPGDKALAFVNPWNPSVLVACKPNGAVIGLCEPWDTPCKNDVDSVKRQLGRQAHWQAQRTNALAARHLDAATTRAHMLAHNAALLSGKPLSPEEKHRAAELDARITAEGPAALDAILSPTASEAPSLARPTGEGQGEGNSALSTLRSTATEDGRTPHSALIDDLVSAPAPSAPETMSAQDGDDLLNSIV